MDALRYQKNNYPSNCNCSLFICCFWFDLGCTSYNGLFLFFFKLQIGTRQETISTHGLQPWNAYQDVQAAEFPHRGRLPNTSKLVPLWANTFVSFRPHLYQLHRNVAARFLWPASLPHPFCHHCHPHSTAIAARHCVRPLCHAIQMKN